MTGLLKKSILAVIVVIAAAAAGFYVRPFSNSGMNYPGKTETLTIGTAPLESSLKTGPQFSGLYL